MYLRTTYSRGILAALAVLMAWPAHGRAGEPPLGYSLKTDWDDAWRRVLDSNGRFEPQGPVQQSFAAVQYPEYRMDLAVSSFPLRWERWWSERDRGARLWVQSLDEYQLANRVALFDQAPLGDWGHVGVRFDRYQARHVRSDLVRVEFGADRIGDHEVGVALRLYPRWEKDDSDAELVATLPVGELARARLRLLAIDPFNNAALALRESRGGHLAKRTEQMSLPLAAAAEVATRRVLGVRAEVYTGAIWPRQTRLDYAQEPELDHTRSDSGWLGGAMVEWKPEARFALGASVMTFRTRLERDFDAAELAERIVDERTDRVLVYTLLRPWPSLSGEAYIAWTQRARIEDTRGVPTSAGGGPEPAEPGVDPLEIDPPRLEDVLLGALRATWMAGEHVGVEGGWMRIERQRDGFATLGGDQTARDNRIVTRLVVDANEAAWASLGVNWDVDPGDGLYDGGGMTIVLGW